ncbi:MAG: nitronate monooxygenase [Legionellaceae bacterium]|nr:nitronate monooxygenase [Legionellaceae bacterium]
MSTNINSQANSDILKLLDIQYPIISAPMGNIAGGRLATAVSQAGGLGLIGGGYCDTDWIAQQLDIAGNQRFGIGFISWRLKDNVAVLDRALERNPQAIMLSFGDIAPFVQTIKSKGIPLICQVQSVEQAMDCKNNGADIIVAQGTEAGGHAAEQSTLPLVPAIIDAVGPTPVIAAGGICDARGVNAARALGAQGVLMGTRFMASHESLASEKAKKLMLSAKACDTMRTRVFDYARGYDWPEPYTARVLQNLFTQTWHGQTGLKSLINAEQQALYLDACARSDFDIAGLFVGEGVDLIHEILPASTIVEQLARAFG